MEQMRIKVADLKKLDTLIESDGRDNQDIITISPEHLMTSIAVSLKRIADNLDDGLTSLVGDQVLGLADIAAGILEVGIRKG